MPGPLSNPVLRHSLSTPLCLTKPQCTTVAVVIPLTAPLTRQQNLPILLPPICCPRPPQQTPWQTQPLRGGASFLFPSKQPSRNTAWGVLLRNLLRSPLQPPSLLHLHLCLRLLLCLPLSLPTRRRSRSFARSADLPHNSWSQRGDHAGLETLDQPRDQATRPTFYLTRSIYTLLLPRTRKNNREGPVTQGESLAMTRSPNMS